MVRKKCPAIGRWACATVAHPKQQDSASCGVFVCKTLFSLQSKLKRWDQLLQGTMFGLRTKTQFTTKFSPYYRMFGREARYPSEVPKEYKVGTKKRRKARGRHGGTSRVLRIEGKVADLGTERVKRQ
ncbi:hypothetical protein F7725_010585 [Dissostichus mawsoni]|uniref:Ubiquitin-like protease family profile domain-containing protein n=1 Tax=Dissostichus mawsoni TaxID=36200 RepID=A0A7J5XQF5_DISMA|nr:hypothetical protein F7725_010585 [Dissostichus mawsoni]